ncbi:MAG: GtrA family protein [Kiritimatiellae bacterium]|nr:GtrA family protein [Kiritimatiellia bacterium]
MFEWITRFIEPALFWELVWYFLSGVCSTLVSQIGYSVCFRKFALSNVCSKTLSWFAAATTAFLMMRWLAFSTTESGFWESAWLFFSTRIGTVLVTVALMWVVMDCWLKWDLTDRERVRKEYGWWPEIINLIVTILEIAVNYFIAKYWVF